MGVVLGMAAAGVMLGATAAVRAASLPAFEPVVMPPEFKEVAPGMPFQEGRPQPLKQRPEGKAAIVYTLLDAMGFVRAPPGGGGAALPGQTTHTINRLRYSGSGEGTGVLVEQGHTYQITQYVYGMSLYQDAAREDIEAQGPDGPVHLIRVVLGNEAWDESAPGVGTHSADALARERQLQLARTPFGIAEALTHTKGLAYNRLEHVSGGMLIEASEVKVHDPGAGGGAVTLQLPLDGVSAQVVLDQNYRPVMVTQRVDRHLIVDHYSDYLDLSQYGLMVPTHIEETIDGHAHLNVRINYGAVVSYEVFPRPAFEATPAAAPPAWLESDYPGLEPAAADTSASEQATPRTADGHPDFNGYWGTPPAKNSARGTGNKQPAKSDDSDEASVQLFAARNGDYANHTNDNWIGGEDQEAGVEQVAQNGDDIPLYKPQYWSQVVNNGSRAGVLDPQLMCMAITPPRLGPPIRIVQLPHEVFFWQKQPFATNSFRDIPVGQPGYPPDIDGSWQGDPAARWEGDTLVVETVGYNGQSWIGPAGWPHGYHLKSIERLHRQGNELTYDVTIEDPEYLQRPWVLPTQHVQLIKGHAFAEIAPCVERDVVHIVRPNQG